MQLPYHNMRIKHWNPGAAAPLILPLEVVCNTSDDAIYDNVRHNSRLPQQWMKSAEPHDRIAVICGSGPSIKERVEQIRDLYKADATIFALNGCAAFLAKNDILPTYQVILDAREETADLIGPALQHLFASQVHPECFKRVPSAWLWHLDVGKALDELLPEEQPEHVQIGGAATVGNTSLCLAYAMGFRTLKLFGYDSSHKDGDGHAFRQKMNDGDPCAYVDFNGKTYLCSLTMKMQAEKFMTTSQDLKTLGVQIEVFGEGLLPDMFHAPKEVLEEANKYSQMWSHPDYRKVSPGELLVGKFLEVCNPSGKVIDFGCGTGRASLRMKDAGLEPLLIDFTTNSRDPEAMSLPFVQADLTLPSHERAPWGFCADVMEHLPPELVKSAIHNILESAEQVFFQISTVHDEMGALINEPLHLTVRPHAWWMATFALMGDDVIWNQEQPTASLFHVKRKSS